MTLTKREIAELEESVTYLAGVRDQQSELIELLNTEATTLRARAEQAEAALTALTARHDATVAQLRTAYDNMRAAEMRDFGGYVNHCGRAGKETQALVDTVARLSGGERSGA